jgi:quinol monooxygenase YgiN
MVIIAGTVDVEIDNRDAALEAAKPHMKATRAQKGCMDYVWSPDSLVPGRIYVFERWETEEDLKLHFKGEHYWNMRTTINSYTLLDIDMHKYRMDVMEPVYDPEGNPRGDFFTIE